MKLRIESGKESFYQWDTNHRLIVEEADMCQQVHFCHSTDANALVCEIREEEGKRVVDVPNLLLQSDEMLRAYLISVAEDGTATRYAQSFDVISRPKPEDYVYTETEVQTYTALEKRIAALEEGGDTGGGGVKTVNGVAPDETGNVEIEIPDSEVEIPEALPNPNALTFTGAVEATYDGSQAVSVEIPQGGGSGSDFYSGLELIVDHTVTAEEATAASIAFTNDAYPLINSQKLLLVEIAKPASVSTPWFAVKCGTVETVNPDGGTWNYYRMVADASNGIWMQNFKQGTNILVSDMLAPSYRFVGSAAVANKNKAFADYTSITLTSYQAFLEENTTIKIWGGKA